ncbi:MAG TPA: TonB family protein [Ignavibacteria bacterium]|mgnify:CR=1 FL=1|nr:TonB family protein [Ignavibacteria bacterium]HRJ98253.1 TonB family protein [Ignavibacteria bacterium]
MSNHENIDNSNEVFEQINKKMKYGAPDLKKFYQKYVTRGLIIAVILHGFFIGGYALAMYYEKVKAEQDAEQQDRIVNLQDLDVPPPIDEIPPEPPKDIALKDLSALTPEPVAKKEVVEEVKLKSQKELEEVKLPVASTGTDDPNLVNPNAEFTGKVQEKKIEEKVEKKEEKKKDVFQQFEVEKAPVAVNLGSIKGSMRYPEIARQSGIEGRVVAKVLVGTDGSVIKVGGISGPEVFRDEVADKVMGLQFTPALQNGQPVKCWVSVPFSFTLSAKDKKKTETEEEDE